MLNALDFVADGRQYPEFLFQFAAQGVARLLALLDLAAGELPFERHGLVPCALTHQQLAVLHDQPCNHALHEAGTVAAWRALATGSTQLVKVKANAATPAAQRSSRVCGPKAWSSTRKYMRAESMTV
jgi:hypothetical protein